MTTSVLPPQACLACGHVMDRHAHMSTKGAPPAIPMPGDITLCIQCGFVMAYDENLRFRDLTKKEMEEAIQDERVQKAIVAIAELNKHKRQ